MNRFIFILSCCGLALCVNAAEDIPEKGLVARYRASDVKVEEGEGVKRWPAAAGSNPVPLVLLEDLPEDEKVLAPTLHSVQVTGFDHQGVRFVAGENGQRELLQAGALLPDATRGRTVLVAYRNLEHNSSGAARIGGFGSSVTSKEKDDRKVWNFGADADVIGGYGSFRFDGAFIGPHKGKTPQKGKLILRAMIRHPDDRFTDYIQPAHDFFQLRKVLDRGKSSKQVGPFPGDFYVGDSHRVSVGGDKGAFAWELFDVLVYDRALSEAEVEQALKSLNWRYTNPAE